MLIYEARDTTNDEMYYSMGYFGDVEKLLTDIRNTQDPNDILSGYNDLEETACLEVVQYELGKWDEGKTIHRFFWTSNYNKEKEDYEWVGPFTEK